MINSETRDFIKNNAEKDIRLLALSGTRHPDVNLPFALDQIAGRQTAKKKLPSWAVHEDIIYPPHLSMEQCSSERTALYKKTLTEGCTGTFVDLTGGFGVDFSFMSHGFQKGIYVERQEHLCDIARHNFALLGMDHVEVVCGDSVDYLKSIDGVSVIYLDPARRNEHGGKTYAISDCAPDVAEIKNLLQEKAKRVIVKLSPMLDWHKAINDLGNAVTEVHIVSVDNECKELLLVMQSPGAGKVDDDRVKVVCVNNEEVFVSFLNSSDKTLSIKHYELSINSTLSTERYLYEPNASIMKAGCFMEVCSRYDVAQLERNSHLFVSESFIEDFPGRKFQINAVSTLNKKDIKNTLSSIDRANITVRNFPMSVDALRKRLKIKEGGSDYIFATTLMDKSHVLLLCSRL